MIKQFIKVRNQNFVWLKNEKSIILYIFFLPAQLAPVNPVLQVHVPVEASQVPWPEQSSGQVRSYE